MSESVKTTRLKSPPYPSLPLQRAIERAEQLYREERDHLVPIVSVARAWGMSPTSSGPIQTTGALRQYGLLEDEGGGEHRKVRLTHDALRILMDKDPNSKSRKDAIKRCFLNPKIFAEMWEQWKPDLPADQTVLRYLTLDRRLNNQAPFSESAATELLSNYRISLSFAGLTDVHSGAVASEQHTELDESESQFKQGNQPDAKAVMAQQTVSRALPIARTQPMEHERVLSDGLLSKSATYRLIVSGRIGVKELQRLIKKLEIDTEILADDDEGPNQHSDAET